MGYASKARKEFAKEQELEKLRARKNQQDARKAEADKQANARWESLTQEEREALTPQMEKSAKRKKFTKVAIVLVIIALGIIGSKQSQTTSSQSPAASTRSSIDIMTQKSCEDFTAASSGISKGITTGSEARKQIQSVYNNAQYSTDADIVAAATEMLAAITSAQDTNDYSAFMTAAVTFGNTCIAHAG